MEEDGRRQFDEGAGRAGAGRAGRARTAAAAAAAAAPELDPALARRSSSVREIEELRAALESLGRSTEGNKPTLVERLIERGARRRAAQPRPSRAGSRGRARCGEPAPRRRPESARARARAPPEPTDAPLLPPPLTTTKRCGTCADCRKKQKSLPLPHAGHLHAARRATRGRGPTQEAPGRRGRRRRRTTAGARARAAPRARLRPRARGREAPVGPQGRRARRRARRDNGGDKLQAVICAALPNMPAWHVTTCSRSSSRRASSRPSRHGPRRRRPRLPPHVVERRGDALRRRRGLVPRRGPGLLQARRRPELVARVKAIAAAEAASLVTHADNRAVDYWRRHGFEAACAGGRQGSTHSDSTSSVLGAAHDSDKENIEQTARRKRQRTADGDEADADAPPCTLLVAAASAARGRGRPRQFSRALTRVLLSSSPFFFSFPPTVSVTTNYFHRCDGRLVGSQA